MTVEPSSEQLYAGLVTSEQKEVIFFDPVDQLTMEVVKAALDEIEQCQTFRYLPRATLTVLRLPDEDSPFETLGALSVFRGGRIQWHIGEQVDWSQHWQAPHIYASRTVALQLWQDLMAGDVEKVAGAGWRTEQTRLCPICGFELAARNWMPAFRPAEGAPPRDIAPYEACGSCGTTFGLDYWKTYGEMRDLWLAQQPVLTPQARENLMRTPTDLPTSESWPED